MCLKGESGMDHRINGDFPRAMCRGSHGPHVVLFQAFICRNGPIPAKARDGYKLVIDGDFGQVTVNLLLIFQEANSLPQTGNFDETTQEHAKYLCGFDFEAACRKIPGTTVFVQSDLTNTLWINAA